MVDVMYTSLIHVMLGSIWTVPLVFLGLFKDVFTENGFEHYAEVPQIISLYKHPLMLGNTFVNFGYVAVGFAWLYNTRYLLQNNILRSSIDAYVFSCFSWMSVLYGFVQLFRIVTQWHEFAVLDQWFTLPIFMWAYVSCDYIKHGWDTRRVVVLMAVSFFSYLVTLASRYGFELALCLHIILVLQSVTQLTLSYRSYHVQLTYALLLMSCTGFVILKLVDLELPRIHKLFSVVSGHFLSKIADILQIHFGMKYFIYVVLAKHKED